MLIPTISMFLIYVFVYWGNLSSLGYCALGEYKFGYWFTFALFLMNIIHWVVSEIFKLLRFDERKTMTYSLCFLFIISVLIIILKDWDWNYDNGLLSRWFSLRLIAMYFPFYLIGLACKQYERLFHRLICNEYVVVILVIAFVASLFLFWNIPVWYRFVAALPFLLFISRHIVEQNICGKTTVPDWS